MGIWKHSALLLLAALLLPAGAGATVYFVSSSAGSDANSGLSPAASFCTVARVNALDLSAGDEVRFRCGDLWRGETLVVRDSGTVSFPIRVTSDPTGCQNRPVLSGAFGISGWQPYSGQIYVADLDQGANAGRLPHGINQLFRDGSRLPLGRWPNLGSTSEGGYATIEGQPAANRIVDDQLPAGNWTGAVFHHKSERWYLFSRLVTASSGTRLTLNDSVVCRNGCVGWGYFLNGHLATLDLPGEWYHDPSTNRVYLVSDSGAPADGQIEASVLPAAEVDNQSGVVLGGAHPEHVRNVIIENLEVRDWAGSGIMMARVFRDDQNSDVEIRGNVIVNVAQVGIRLASYVYAASEAGNGPNGWRGGSGCVVADNLIDGANLFGIETYSVDSMFLDNELRNIALVENLVRDGMGCGFTGTACPLSGSGIRIKQGGPDQTGYSGSGNTLRHNRLDRVGVVGIDVLVPNNLVERNVISEACATLADCGGIRTYGGSSFATTAVRNITIKENIILDSVGNLDGAADPFKDPWGLGIYVDYYSDDVDVIDNTVVGSTSYGIAFGSSRGTVTGNTLYRNSTGTSFASHVVLYLQPTEITIFDYIIYGPEAGRPALEMDSLGNLLGSDLNYYFCTRDDYLVRVQDLDPVPLNLAEWQAYSGQDDNSADSWMRLEPSDPTPSVIFFNDTKESMLIDLGGALHYDLDQNPVTGSFTLDPFASRILIRDETAFVILNDGFESGDTSGWSTASP